MFATCCETSFLALRLNTSQQWLCRIPVQFKEIWLYNTRSVNSSFSAQMCQINQSGLSSQMKQLSTKSSANLITMY